MPCQQKEAQGRRDGWPDKVPTYLSRPHGVRALQPTPDARTYKLRTYLSHRGRRLSAPGGSQTRGCGDGSIHGRIHPMDAPPSPPHPLQQPPGLKSGQACKFHPWTPSLARAAAAQNSPVATAGPLTLSLVGTLPSGCQGWPPKQGIWIAPRSTALSNLPPPILRCVVSGSWATILRLFVMDRSTAQTDSIAATIFSVVG